MKILYITNGINGPGGLERVLSIKASMLADEYGYEIVILGLNKGNENPFYSFSSKIKFVNIDVPSPKHPLNYFRDYKKGIRTVVQNEQPHIIAVCDNGLKAFFIPKLLKTNAKIIYERHAAKIASLSNKKALSARISNWILCILLNHLSKGFDSFIVLTNGNKAEWNRTKNIIVIPNPISFNIDSRAKLEKKIVLNVGAISFRKGQDLLLQIWNKVHKKFPDWELHLYGKEDLQFLDTNNLPSKVYHFNPIKDIKQKYLDSSIYLMSSRNEGFGMVLIEAMACGVPCISFDCPQGPADIITNKKDGFLIENENINKFADKVILLINDENQRKILGKNAQEDVRKYEIKNILKEWISLFENLIS